MLRSLCTQREIAEKEVQYGCRKIFQFVHEILTAMGPHYADLSLKLFLEAAQAADQCEAAPFKLIAYEFITQVRLVTAEVSLSSTKLLFPLPPQLPNTQAFLLYEDELTDSKTQIRALASMMGTLLKTRNFDESDYDALSTKTTQYAAKLLKKPDQCRMVAMASHLFYIGAEVSESSRHKGILQSCEGFGMSF